MLVNCSSFIRYPRKFLSKLFQLKTAFGYLSNLWQTATFPSNASGLLILKKRTWLCPSNFRKSFCGYPLPHKKRNPSFLTQQSRPLATGPCFLQSCSFSDVCTLYTQAMLIAISQNNRLLALGLHVCYSLNPDCSSLPFSLQSLHWLPALGFMHDTHSSCAYVHPGSCLLQYNGLLTHPSPDYNGKFQDGA